MSHWIQRRPAWGILLLEGPSEGKLLSTRQYRPIDGRGLGTALFETRSDAQDVLNALVSKGRIVKLEICFAEVNKFDHVRDAQQTRPHTCHWPNCAEQVPPAMWGCREHWFRLPKKIRNQIWKAYEPGQEETFLPSAAYREAVQEAQNWIAAQETNDPE